MAFSAADSVKPVSVAADRQIFAVPTLEGAIEVAALECEVTVHIAGTVFFIIGVGESSARKKET